MSTVTQEDGGLDLVIGAVGDHVLCYPDDRIILVLQSEGFANRVVKSKGAGAFLVDDGGCTVRSVGPGEVPALEHRPADGGTEIGVDGYIAEEYAFLLLGHARPFHK